ncbi:hypothetical protein [Bacillus sp. B-jedd]|uniref:hypothetical protein n=1 Tax=Bacillus sp. B-jedd TaxID=1476857 RepID=UPI0005156011|nr:hypothetical protein [Bacillus sp. B-jedd]CEG27191.1 hypothetical protein BN1002_02047 [Bacillus sp. B-jedd]
MKEPYIDGHLDGAFAQLNADLVWDTSRRQAVKNNINKSMLRQQKTGRTKELVVYYSSLAAVLAILLIGAAQFLPIKEADHQIASQGQEWREPVGSIIEVDGVKSLVFTTEAIVPLNLVGVVPGVRSEVPTYKVDYRPESYIWFPTEDNQISMHTNINKTGQTNDLQTVPPLREEVVINNQRALISNRDLGYAEIFISTKNYDYYISGAKRDVLIEFAKQIKFRE